MTEKMPRMTTLTRPTSTSSSSTTTSTSTSTSTSNSILTSTSRKERSVKVRSSSKKPKNESNGPYQAYQNMKLQQLNYRSTIDCGQKECLLRHQLLKDCIVYSHKNNTDCMIPCKLDNCEKTFHHFMNCPIWECHSKTTTTSTTTTEKTTTTSKTTTERTTTATPDYTTTSTFSPTTPIPSPVEFHYSILFFLSIGIHCITLFAICCFCFYRRSRYCRRFRRRRQRSRSNVPLLPNDHRFFSIGSENDSNSDIDPPRSATDHSATTDTAPAGTSAPLLNERNPNSSLFEDIDLGSSSPRPYYERREYMVMRDYSNYSTFRPQAKTQTAHSQSS